MEKKLLPDNWMSEILPWNYIAYRLLKEALKIPYFKRKATRLAIICILGGKKIGEETLQR